MWLSAIPSFFSLQADSGHLRSVASPDLGVGTGKPLWSLARNPLPDSKELRWWCPIRPTSIEALAPLVALRQHYPNDLWVNEHYQDAVQQYGIEGHLRKLTEEYQVLSMQHPDDLMYSYLYARSLMGRNTAPPLRSR